MIDLSVVTISYNQVEYLEQCIQSVHTDPKINLEHIIIDAGSTDGSRELIFELANKFSNMRYVFEPDKGPADGLNKGFAMAKGRYIAYLNSDDMFAPEGLRGMLESIAALDCDVVFGNGWQIDRQGSPRKYLVSDRFSPNRYALAIGIVVQQATIFRKSFLDRHSIRFNVENRVSWDIELLFQCFAANARMSNVHKAFAYFRVYEDTITGSGAYSTQLKKQRQHLLRQSSFAKIAWFANALAYPMRGLKFARKLVFLAVHRPTFPGVKI